MLSFLCPRALTSPSPLAFVRCTPRRLLPPTRCLHQRAIPSRPLSTTSRRPAYKTIQELRSHARSGPFSARAGVLFLTAGFGMIFYFRYEKARVERKRVAEMSKGAGRPKVGGEFTLVDHEGRPFGDGDMKGGFALVYFGFTHCPDICPEELDKMARMIDLVSPSTTPINPVLSSSTAAPTSSIGPITPPPTSPPSPPPTDRAPLLSLFITCDPARDTPSVLKTYLAEFHPSILGLTGSWQQVKDVCKKYRVYFSTPEGVKPGMDYLVDHSIYFYLMDPDGDFVEAIGRQHSPEAAARIIKEHMSDWKGGAKRS